MSGKRLDSILGSADSTTPDSTSGDASSYIHRTDVPTLSQLLALILYPPPNFLPPKSGLLVIDGLHHVVDLDYPRSQGTTSGKTEAQKWQSGRRYTLLGSLVSALNKLAVLNNVAVIVTTGCSDRMRYDSGMGAAMVPGVGGVEWDSGVCNRFVVFRDYNTRYIGVQKCHGRSLISRDEVGIPGHLIPFTISANGKVQGQSHSTIPDFIPALPPQPSPVKRRKRIREEIEDSEGDDVDEYGWAETDEYAPAAEGLFPHGITAAQNELEQISTETSADHG